MWLEEMMQDNEHGVDVCLVKDSGIDYSIAISLTTVSTTLVI